MIKNTAELLEGEMTHPLLFIYSFWAHIVKGQQFYLIGGLR
ncbi:hypothetical protein JMA_17310 [Jeotgalibacillus malaysiensis]|uniref:Uncharacterized protein n=1 Tax=Jeotgalibacillus malaysiensis TaxID=1508404 RepID=A0A0B5ARA0_9BACL|nr:hypothetical protein JMA_17310 [Jeotgalibacillus malaysiensis]